MAVDRQTIMEVNRSLRNIKTELENLLEKGVIDDSVYDTISTALPAESPLSGPLRTANGSSNPDPAAKAATPTPAPAPAASLPTKAFESLSIKSPSPAPPAYDQTPPPGLPARSAKPIVAQARALYRYAGSDGRDLSFEKDDHVNVFEYMNQDWWMGQNQRTGLEGIFPRNYVLVEQEHKIPVAQPQYGYPDHKQGPPQQQNPYNAHVPPMAVAEGSGQHQEGAQGDSKVNQYGKKFGKKLGNAAIFGAGATIGGNIVNSIF
ncbi:protein that induces appearance of [PIN+] prion when overproduced [Neonectria punicea]|uniref:Protein that induces appearance of [PIN+] prion when overproduced n=1 Tax=Neonectria punicea TaxID=979145 RepID=A0ABR1HEL8_9HYPO